MSQVERYTSRERVLEAAGQAAFRERYGRIVGNQPLTAAVDAVVGEIVRYLDAECVAHEDDGFFFAARLVEREFGRADG